MRPDQRVKYLVPVAMVVVAILAWIALSAISTVIGMEEAEGLAGLWLLVTPALLLMAAILAAIFMVHDLIETKKPSQPAP